MFTSFLLKTKLYNDNVSKEWSWNIFKPSFWVGWSSITHTSQAFGVLINQYSFSSSQLNNDFELWKTPYVQLDLQNFISQGASTHNMNFSSIHSTPGNGSLVFETPSHNGQDTFNVVPKVVNYVPKSLEKNNCVATPWSSIPPFLELSKSVPSNLIMSPLLPTPSQFIDVSFKQIVRDGLDLSKSEFDNRGRNLQVILWVFLLLFFFCGFYLLYTLTSIYVSYIINDNISLATIIASLYVLGLMLFLASSYIIYLHIFWQFANDRFASFHDFVKAVVKQPLLILPLKSLYKKA